MASSSTAGAGGRPVPQAGSAFLLAQIGAHAAGRFAERISELDLTPADAGLLRAIAIEPGRSQQAVAAQLGAPATRLVALVDRLQARGLLERRRNPRDRRLHALHLTTAGHQLLQRIATVATTHERDITAALTDGERDTLRDLLTRIAQAQGLTPGVHPGYRTLRPGRPGVRADQASTDGTDGTGTGTDTGTGTGTDDPDSAQPAAR